MGGFSCGMICTKYLLFVFNFIIWVCGIAALVVGIYSRIKGSDWDSLVNDNTILNAANIMIAAGGFVMIIGFLGCCGALKESKCLLILYAIALIAIFVLEIAAGIFVYIKKDTVISNLETGLNKTVTLSYGQPSKSDKILTKAMDWFQEHIKCCGSKGPADWATSKWKISNADNNVPRSCCMKDVTCNNKTIYTEGCVKAGEKFVKDNIWKIGGVALGIAFVQFIGIVFAIKLYRKISEESTVGVV